MLRLHGEEQRVVPRVATATAPSGQSPILPKTLRARPGYRAPRGVVRHHPFRSDQTDEVVVGRWATHRGTAFPLRFRRSPVRSRQWLCRRGGNRGGDLLLCPTAIRSADE